MNYTLSKRVERIGPSATLVVSAKARRLREAGEEIIDWSTGEPDFLTPAHICEAASQAIRDGQHRYTAVGGTVALRTAIREKLIRDNKLTYEVDQILVSAGVKQALYNTLQTLINTDDEVIILAPYWASYPDMVRLAGGKPVILETTQAQNFCPSIEGLKAAITKRTRLIILNSPANPSGGMFDQAFLESVAEVLRVHPNVLIASDDIYELIRFDGTSFHNIVQVAPDLMERTLVFNGVSKAYAMTGWRIGYVAGPAKIIEAMRNIQSQSTSNPCSIAQAATIAALNGDQSSVIEMVDAFRERRNYLVKALNALPGVSCLNPHGAFYCLPDVTEAMQKCHCASDIDFAQVLLDKQRLTVVPGTAFGAPGHVRISYACSLDTLRKGIERLHTLLG